MIQWIKGKKNKDENLLMSEQECDHWTVFCLPHLKTVFSSATVLTETRWIMNIKNKISEAVSLHYDQSTQVIVSKRTEFKTYTSYIFLSSQTSCIFFSGCFVKQPYFHCKYLSPDTETWLALMASSNSIPENKQRHCNLKGALLGLPWWPSG